MCHENQCPTAKDGQPPKKCIQCSAINLCVKPKDKDAAEWRKYRTGR